eukprot:TRINITY_DN25395_c0_g1_i1.p1 TRINITY_DN25395_c0_g1~~TRINITY_DN25395_c0_g1_i1.p1  ORF type:complete len:235 (+),score=92.87 TRINITY_DN25395_c0_g1_i1:35-739(+)
MLHATEFPPSPRVSRNVNGDLAEMWERHERVEQHNQMKDDQTVKEKTNQSEQTESNEQESIINDMNDSPPSQDENENEAKNEISGTSAIVSSVRLASLGAEKLSKVAAKAINNAKKGTTRKKQRSAIVSGNASCSANGIEGIVAEAQKMIERGWGINEDDQLMDESLLRNTAFNSLLKDLNKLPNEDDILSRAKELAEREERIRMSARLQRAMEKILKKREKEKRRNKAKKLRS